MLSAELLKAPLFFLHTVDVGALYLSFHLALETFLSEMHGGVFQEKWILHLYAMRSWLYLCPRPANVMKDPCCIDTSIAFYSKYSSRRALKFLRGYDIHGHKEALDLECIYITLGT